MKQRITRKDLGTLTDEQKRRLNELWAPSVYDAAVARILKNVATDEYDEYEFVVGRISLSGTSVYLTDIVARKDGLQSSSESSDTIIETSKVDPVFGESYLSYGNREDFNKAAEGMEEAFADQEYEDENAEEPEEDFQEEDLEDNYQLPTVFMKSDCAPLLTLGNMIEILKENNYGKFDFFLAASTYDIGCELGREDSSWGNNIGWEPAELCDVLWESVKELL